MFIEPLVWYASIFEFFLWIFCKSVRLSIFLTTLVNISYGVCINSYFAEMLRKNMVIRMLATPLALVMEDLS